MELKIKANKYQYHINFVSNIISEPSNSPNVILNIPATPLNTLVRLIFFLPIVNGNDNKSVIIDIDKIVPSPNIRI